MKFSVVIPVLNERECLPTAIDSIRLGIPDAEIIAADGGSSDGSREWLLQQPDVRVLDSARGKGVQLNTGAHAAGGEALIFLHADVQLPAGAGKAVSKVLAEPGVAGGAFRVRFAERNPLSLRVLAALMNLRMRVLHRCFGDQAVFVRKSTWERIGGFPDWPLFEDYEFVRQLRRHGKFGIVLTPITISARRFLKKGVWRTVALVGLLQIGFHLGVSPATLKTWFPDIRPHLSAES